MKPFPTFGEKQNKIEGNNVKHELKSEESKGVQSEEKDINSDKGILWTYHEGI